MLTRKTKEWQGIAWGFIGIFVLFIPIARAQTPFDFTLCATGTNTMVFESKELTVLGRQGMGIIFSNHENRIFNDMTWLFVGIDKIADGKPTALLYSKFVDPDGDIIVGEFAITEAERTLKFLHGSGKWKGIKGEGKGKRTAGGKPAAPGTYQTCVRYTGTLELPK